MEWQGESVQEVSGNFTGTELIAQRIQGSGCIWSEVERRRVQPALKISKIRK